MPKLKQSESSIAEAAEPVVADVHPVQAVKLDPSSPGIRSIVRVVVVTLVLLWIGSYLETVITSLKSLFFILILSVFFAYLLDPLVRGIRLPFKSRNVEWLMPRVLAILIAYIVVFTVVGIAVASIAPRVVDQAKEFGANVPTYANSARERLNDLNRRFDRLKVPDEVQAELNKKAADIGSGITSAVGGFVLLTASFVPWLVLIPILAFFFLKDVNLFRLAVLRAFPAGKLRMRAENVLADVNTTLAAYTRAQIISCLLIGFICTIAFYVIGLKYALLLGILAAIFEFVPLLGPATIGLIVILTATFGDDPWRGLYVGIFLIVLRLVQDYVFYPRIVREGIHLHPIAIILSVLAGEQIAGIPGVFLSIPIVAVATVIYRNLLEHQGRRGLFAGAIENPAAELMEAD